LQRRSAGSKNAPWRGKTRASVMRQRCGRCRQGLGTGKRLPTPYERPPWGATGPAYVSPVALSQGRGMKAAAERVEGEGRPDMLA